MFELTVRRSFAAAHCLRAYEGPCARLHGHNYQVTLTIAGGELNESGMLMDFGELKRICDGVIDGLDHRYLNDLPPFTELNPTSENLARYIFERVAEALEGNAAKLSSVQVWESESSVATYRDGG